MSRLSPEVVALLRESVKQWLDDESADDAGLRGALHAVATEAREHGVRAEELVVALKSTWVEVGGVPSAPPAVGGQKRLDELVTACIKAYYG